jgi:HEAT repeat protein
VALVAVLGGSLAIEPARAGDLGAAFKALGSHRWGQDQEAIETISRACVEAHDQPERRALLERQLLAVLQSADGTDAGKQFACRKLSLIGSRQSVGALAKLLDDEDLSHMARYALQRIDDPASAEALRDAAGRLEGKLLIGVINSLGARRDAEAVDVLAPMLASSQTASAARDALAEIGTAGACKALRRAGESGSSPAMQLAIIRCAGRLAEAGHDAQAGDALEQVAADGPASPVVASALLTARARLGEAGRDEVVKAISGEEGRLRAVALSLVRNDVPGPEATKGFARALKGLPADAQVALLEALAERGDAAALPAVKELTGDSSVEVARAAVEAVGRLGGADEVAMLAERLDSEAVGSAAAEAMGRLRGEGVDGAIARRVAGAGDVERKCKLIKVLERRKSASSVEAMAALVREHDDQQVRSAALGVLAAAGGDEQMELVVQRLVEGEGAELRSAYQAAEHLLSLSPEPEAHGSLLAGKLDEAEGVAEAMLIRLLPQAGGETALKALAKQTRSDNETVRDAAIRSLDAWDGLEGAEVALDVARDAKDTKYHVLAMRAVARIVGGEPKLGRRRVALLVEGIEVARRVEEKQLMLSGLGRIEEPEALKAALKHVEDKDLGEAACQAVVSICRSRRMARRHKEPCREALEAVGRHSGSEKTRQRAAEALKRIR